MALVTFNSYGDVSVVSVISSDFLIFLPPKLRLDLSKSKVIIPRSPLYRFFATLNNKY